MASRFGLAILLLAIAMVVVVDSSPIWDVPHLTTKRGGDGGLPTCNGLVGDCIDPNEEMMMESESARRQLRGAGFIGYGALNRNNVPCRRRGASYYACRPGRANPYARGCNRITTCRRL